VGVGDGLKALGYTSLPLVGVGNGPWGQATPHDTSSMRAYSYPERVKVMAEDAG